jgi:hypothetical protein
VSYWSGGFFYVKDVDVENLASSKRLPAFKDGPAAETSAWTASPHISESLAMVKLVRADLQADRMRVDGEGSDIVLVYQADPTSSTP